ncbi:uncharacterized protein BDCG_16727, partial [Blastomyces dermatitidis ER-3]
SLHVDRFTFTDNSEPDVTFLIENLKNAIMKKLSVSCVARSPAFSLTSSAASSSAASLSVSFSVTSQSSTLAPVSGSPALTTPVLMTPGFTASAFVTSSPCFKKMLYRLNESHLSTKDIHVFRNENTDVVLFYTHRCETCISCLKFTSVSEIILIKDDNITETIFSHSQASLITFSLFSVRKVVHTLS